MPKATIGGVPIIGDGSVTWKSTIGVVPHIAEFSVPLGSVGDLLTRGRAQRLGTGSRVPGLDEGLTLEIETEVGGPAIFKNLFVLSNSNAGDPNIGRVRVCDRRYWWKYILVNRYINRRRRVGTLRRGLWDDDVLQVGVVDDLTYATFSIPSRVKSWDPVAILKAVIEQVDGNAPIIQDETSLKKLPIENLDLVMNGHKAIDQLLAAIPGSELTIDPNGRVRVFSYLSGKEVAEVGEGLIPVHGNAGPEVVGGGHVEKIDHSNTRPSAIDVYFTIESEVRFDFIGDDATKVDRAEPGGSEAAEPQANKTPRHCQNVFPLPDFEALIGAQIQYQGTYVTFLEGLDSYNAELLAKAQGITGGLTFQTLNRAFIPKRTMWAQLDLVGVRLAVNADADWSARINAMQQHYRQTYRIARDWVDRTISMRPYLVATIDRASGQRSPAVAFSDHCIVPNEKGLYRDGVFDTGGLGKREKVNAWNVEGYPVKADGTPGPIVTSGPGASRPAPARVTIEDEDQGVIRANYLRNPYGIEQAILPSKVINIPQRKKNARNRRAVYWNSSLKGDKNAGRVPQLDTVQRIAFVLTLVPVALYRIRVEPKDIKDKIPVAAQASLETAHGPVMDVRIGQGTTTARVGWSDSVAAVTAIEEAFGMGQFPGQQFKDVSAKLKPFVVNDTRTSKTGVGAADLWDTARAAAASIYASEHDRVEGSMTGFLNPIGPIGAINEVSHTVDTNGAATTSYTLRPTIPPLDFLAYMDPSTYRIVLKRVF